MIQSNTLYLGIDDFVQRAIGEKEKFFNEFFFKKHLFTTVVDSPDSLAVQGHKFLYVLYITHIKEELPPLPNNIQKHISSGHCKLILFYPHEGHIYRKYDIERIIDYCKIHKLNRYNTFLFHSNVKLPEQIKNLDLDTGFFTVQNTIYFEHNPWFLNIPAEEEKKLKLCNLYKNRINRDLKENKQYYFNCLNRLPRHHRLLLYVLNFNNEEVKNKIIMSLGSYKLFNNQEVKPDSYNSMFSALGLEMQYLKFLDKKQSEWGNLGILLDTPLIENPTNTLNLFLYKQSYISIISETEVDSGTLFFSEKTFKPIVAGHPFISMNGKHSIKTLQNLGYKTFNKWWDESYDEIDDWRERVLEISRLVKKLCQVDKNKLHQMVIDMEDTLLHNVDVFFNNKRELVIYDRLLEIQTT